ncbi:MAG: MATE family efflux transporter [Flavobacteriales bacterium]|nr:MAG: MATE family efflux transporter [Flavobacteriales bacterium]
MNLTAYTSEFRYNLKLAYPVMLGMIGHTLVAFIDNIMVGQLGTAELAAVSLGNSFVFVAMSLGIGFSTAITPLIAEADASKNLKRGKSVFKHGVVLCGLMGLLLFGTLYLGKPLMYKMGQPEEVVALAIPYLDLVAFSLVPMILFQAFKQFADGMSQTKYPMYATVLANVINVVVNYVLIFGKLGFPQMGIIGAAIGTLLSRVAMLIFIWWLLQSKEKFKPYFHQLKWLSIKKRMFSKIINLGLPSALQMFFEVMLFTAAIWLSGILGKNPQAANQIALNLASMTFMVAVGLSVTAMIRVGNQKGLRDFKELRRIALSIFLLSVILSTLFALIFMIFNTELPKIYLDQNDILNKADNIEVIALAAKLIMVAAVFQIFDGLQVVALGALRGLQDVKIPTFFTLIAYWVVGFPVCYFLGDESRYGSMGIWIGLLCGLAASATLLFVRFHYITNKLISKFN